MSRSPTKRQIQAADRKAQLLETAFRLFAERGYRGTSIRMISRAAGVNEALLYHYFSSKAGLLAAILAAYAPFEPYRRIIAAAGGRPAADVLADLGHAFLALARERRAFMASILAEVLTDPELAAVLGAFVLGPSHAVAELLRQHHPRGTATHSADVQVAARAFQGGLLFHFLSKAMHPPAADTCRTDADFVERLVAFVLTGLEAGPRSPHAS